jgi:F-type H+-transporting ATPase subunit b
MELLRGLGVNATVGIQLVIFLATYLVLHFVLFKPYFRAYVNRVERTMGRAELAERFLAESQHLQTEYERRARELSAQTKTIFDGSRTQAMREYDQLVNEARQAAKASFESSKQKINTEMAGARQGLQGEIPNLAEVITARLLGKDLAQ